MSTKEEQCVLRDTWFDNTGTYEFTVSINWPSILRLAKSLPPDGWPSDAARGVTASITCVSKRKKKP
jgi:hypothetical protein